MAAVAAVAAVEATEPATYGTRLWAKTVFVNLTGRRPGSPYPRSRRRRAPARCRRGREALAIQPSGSSTDQGGGKRRGVTFP